MDMSLVPLLDDTEGDICEQGRENSSLWHAAIAPDEVAFREDAGLEECNDQAVHFRVMDPPAENYAWKLLRINPEGRVTEE